MTGAGLRWAAAALAWAAGPALAAGIELTSPVDYQVVQRATRTGGRIPLAGRLTGLAVADGTTISTRGGEPDAAWQGAWPVAADGSFSGLVDAPAGGWYWLAVRVEQGGAVVAETVVPHVGVGEVFVVAGQSNSANHGEQRQTPATGRVAARNGDRWRLAADPQPGASGDGGSFLPPLGDALVAAFDVPVGFESCGIGATSIREWLPAGTAFVNPPTLRGRVRPLPDGRFESDGRAFDMLCTRMRSLGPNGFRAVLWHQGESDANQGDPRCTLPGDAYRELLETLITASATRIGWRPPWFVAQASYHGPGDRGSPDIRAAQARSWSDGLALAGPDSDALGPEWREAGGRGVHFSGPGLRRHAEAWHGLIAPWLERTLAQGAPAD